MRFDAALAAIKARINDNENEQDATRKSIETKRDMIREQDAKLKELMEQNRELSAAVDALELAAKA